MILLESLRPLFADKLTTDDREPLWTFAIPGWEVEGTFGLYAPLWEPWKQLVLVSKKKTNGITPTRVEYYYYYALRRVPWNILTSLLGCRKNKTSL